MWLSSAQHPRCTSQERVPGTGCDTCKQQLWEYFQLLSLHQPAPSNDLPLTPNVNSLIKIFARAAVTVPRVLCNNYSRDKCSPGDTGQQIPPPKARLSINHRRRGHRAQCAAGYWCEQPQHFQVLCSAIPSLAHPIPHSNFLPKTLIPAVHTPLDTSPQLNQGKATALAPRTLQWHQPGCQHQLTSGFKGKNPKKIKLLSATRQKPRPHTIWWNPGKGLENKLLNYITACNDIKCLPTCSRKFWRHGRGLDDFMVPSNSRHSVSHRFLGR